MDGNTINMVELKTKLKKTDYRSVKKWLKDKKIPIIKEGRTLKVYEWCVDFAIQLEFVECLKRQFPMKWKDIYRESCQNLKMKGAILKFFQNFSQDSGDKIGKPSKKYFK